MDDEIVTLAQARMALRDIDGRIAAIRHETDFYRRMGFGRDIKDIQLMALEEERTRAETRIQDLELKLNRSNKQKQPLTAWLLLPVVVLMMGMDNLSSKRRRSPRESFLEARWRPQARVSFDYS